MLVDGVLLLIVLERNSSKFTKILCSKLNCSHYLRGESNEYSVYVWVFKDAFYIRDTWVHACAVRPWGGGAGLRQCDPDVGLLLKPCFGGVVCVFFVLMEAGSFLILLFSGVGKRVPTCSVLD